VRSMITKRHNAAEDDNSRGPSAGKEPLICTPPSCGGQNSISLSPSSFQRFFISFFRVGSCHHGMARPPVADEGDGFQIWRLAGNIRNK
jgi:hypothetical protein